MSPLLPLWLWRRGWQPQEGVLRWLESESQRRRKFSAQRWSRIGKAKGYLVLACAEKTAGGVKARLDASPLLADDALLR